MADQRRAQQQLGNYQLIKELGRGGFAMVFLGKHIYLGTNAAIKVLRGMLTSNDLDHFLIEARTISILEHPNIVRVWDFDVDGNVPFLVMDYAPNGSLATRHPKGSFLHPSTMMQYVKQVVAALQYAHDQHVIHCDVKPENMLVGRNNEVLLGDFGIAVAVQNVTETGEAMGTIHYMAPEQFAGKPRPATDQYALAVVVYKWLCGRFPFEGSSAIELCHLHTEVPPPPLRKFVPGIPREVEQVVLTALAKDPRQRFKSVQAFATALEAAMQPKPPPQPTPRLPLDQPLSPGDLPEAEPLPPPLPTLSSLLPTIRATVPPHPEPITPPEEPVVTPTPKPHSEEPIDISTILSVSFPPPIPRALVVPLSDAEPGNTTYTGHAAWVAAVAWSPDGRRIASGSWDKIVQIWGAATAQTMLTYNNHRHTVKAVAWSPNGTYIASGSWDSTVRVWYAATGDDLPHYDGHSAQVEAVAWSPNGVFIASASHDCTVQVWKAANRATLLTYRGHAAPVWSVTWSPDGQYIASASHDRTVQVWRATTGEHIFTYQGHTAQVSAVAWSPGGQYIASSSHDGVVQLWHVSSGEILLSYSDNAGAVKALAWSPDGRYIASAVKAVQVWDTKVSTIKESPAINRGATSSPIFTYQGHSAWVNALVWAPDGRSIASASDDQTVQIWHPL
jgi:eukaryotic-like serine/threonine-protein kinase